MINIPPYQPSVTFFGKDGDRLEFKSIQAAIDALGMTWIRRHVRRSWNEVDRFNAIDNILFHATHIAKDSFGCPLDAEDFERFKATSGVKSGVKSKARRSRYYWRAALERWNGEGPVPYIGRRRKGHWYRRPRTMHNRRWATPVREEGEVAPRAKQNAKSFVSSWDDIPRESKENCNWKRFRANQWKSIAARGKYDARHI